MTARVCILTDPSVLLGPHNFPGDDACYVLSEAGLTPLRVALVSPKSANTVPNRSVEAFRNAFVELSDRYNEIIVLVSSQQLHPVQYEAAQKAIESLNKRISILLIDSQTTAAGLLHLVETAAALASLPASEIQRSLLQRLHRVYTIFCTRNLDALASLGSISQEHALISEMLTITSVMVLDGGRLVSTSKVKNARHLADVIQEFVEEFSSPRQLAIIKANLPFGGDAHILRERMEMLLPHAPIVEYNMPPALQAMIGSRSLLINIIDR